MRQPEMSSHLESNHNLCSINSRLLASDSQCQRERDRKLRFGLHELGLFLCLKTGSIVMCRQQGR
jgi:hypothetical protein